MKLPRIATLGLPALVGLLAVSTAGCLFSPDTKPPKTETSDYLPQTSPANVLDNLVKAYNLKNVEEYAKLFDSTEFTFRFDPIDLQNDTDLPEFWDWTVEYDVTKNMFESDDVRRIELEFQKGPVLPVTEDDGEQVDLTWKKMTVTGVHLEVETNNPADPTDPVIFLVSGDRAKFFFKEYPTELIEDEDGNLNPKWRITEWSDIRVEGRPIS
ncbi:MAG: hypothetical protein KDA27_00920 [Candidatus Eisenbacteria bacterium]|uniref:Lipoprotein n=1 Tax=Eiseniibacteriota bacterium TaxID=2212470 RepID=A0A956NC91_UNCEI|nr:hypothetical protein [Candidatus Eisenbacteria bacterium]MCB9462248.1 hypothetical protein [Candidatus Eisenbacteria bacterium]